MKEQIRELQTQLEERHQSTSNVEQEKEELYQRLLRVEAEKEKMSQTYYDVIQNE